MLNVGGMNLCEKLTPLWEGGVDVKCQYGLLLHLWVFVLVIVRRKEKNMKRIKTV